jgi:hypothetical protein
MNDSDVRQRLDAVMAAIGVPDVGPLPDSGDAAESVETQRIATSQIDELLRRVSALTDVLGSGTRRWDHVDRLATQLLLADLTLVASTTRALNRLAASRLSAAAEELIAARRDIERDVQDPS